MQLSIKKRENNKKSEINNIRLHKGIPAVMYSKNFSNQNIFIDYNEFEKAMKNIPQGRLSTAIFELVAEDKKTYKAIIKDIQYHRTTYNIEHIDFLILDDKQPVMINIPIEFSHPEECIGVKQGGALRKVVRKIKVKCLPKNIPAVFMLDVANMGLGECKKVKDIDFAKQNVDLLVDENLTIAIVAKR